MEDLKYPIGKFNEPQNASAENIKEWIRALEELPAALRAAVESMNDEQLDTPYREGGWTPRQVVHHLADSHMNSYIRFKLAVTENNPVIKPYEEARWAELTEARFAPVEISLNLLEALHKRWTIFLRNLSAEDWNRTYHHPESGKDWKLTHVLALYAWHGKHHLAHITSLCNRMNWKMEVA